MRRSLVVVVVLLGLAGCGDVTALAEPGGQEPDSIEVTSADDPPESRLDEPPSVTVTHGATVLDLETWGGCWTGPSLMTCADGAPPDDPPDLGTVTGTVTADFPIDEWEFSATLRGVDGYCGMWIPVVLEQTSDRTWTLPPTGPAGAYEVDLNGRGPEGDVNATFAMRTTADGSMPAPTSSLGLVYDTDGMPTLFDPPNLGLQLVADPTADVAASIDVEAADGQRTLIELAPTPQECLTVGSVALSEGGRLEAATSELVDATERFGPVPYEITVEVVIGGTPYVAAVTYPDDLLPQSVALRTDFEPPLPTADAAAYAPFVDP